MSIGSRIKEARIKNGLKQDELAELIGVTKGAVGNYESDYSSPKDIILYKIFEVLNVDANYIFQDNLSANIKTPLPLTKEEEKLLKAFHQLNDTGKAEAVSRVEELTEISKYSFSAQSSADKAI